ncbi:hypothetical protein IFM89_034647, partial [Coptis chinensis]
MALISISCECGGSYFQPLSRNLHYEGCTWATEGACISSRSLKQKLYIDFKTSNILLDSDGPTGDKSHVSTRVMGTYGYVAPSILL